MQLTTGRWLPFWRKSLFSRITSLSHLLVSIQIVVNEEILHEKWMQSALCPMKSRQSGDSVLAVCGRTAQYAPVRPSKWPFYS